MTIAQEKGANTTRHTNDNDDDSDDVTIPLARLYANCSAHGWVPLPLLLYVGAGPRRWTIS